MIWTHTRCSCAVVVIIPALQNMRFVGDGEEQILPPDHTLSCEFPRKFDDAPRIRRPFRKVNNVNESEHKMQYKTNVISKNEDCGGEKRPYIFVYNYYHYILNKNVETEVIITNESKSIFFFFHNILFSYPIFSAETPFS